MVPITDDYFAIDYVTDRKLPVMLVTNSHYFDAAAGKPIADDTRAYTERYVSRHFPGTAIIDIPTIKL